MLGVYGGALAVRRGCDVGALAFHRGCAEGALEMRCGCARGALEVRWRCAGCVRGVLKVRCGALEVHYQMSKIAKSVTLAPCDVFSHVYLNFPVQIENLNHKPL